LPSTYIALIELAFS